MKLIALLLFVSISCFAENVILDGEVVKTETDITKAIVKIDLYTGKTPASCTGAFVNQSTVLTAAHCFMMNPDTVKIENIGTIKNYFVNPNHKVAQDKANTAMTTYQDTIKKNEPFIKKLQTLKDASELSADEIKLFLEIKKLMDDALALGFEAGKQDFAVLVLEPEDAKNNPVKAFYHVAKENSTMAAKDEYAMVLGYGVSKLQEVNGQLQLTDPGTKNVGYVKLTAAVKDAFYKYEWFQKANKPKASMVGPGDSGGPLIRCKATTTMPTDMNECASMEIMGVNILIMPEMTQEGVKITGNSVDATSKIARTFFDSTINCGKARCAEAF